MTTKERFDTFWTPEPFSGCWLWTGNQRSNAGYGGFSIKHTSYSAHRISWELHRGEIPNGKQILHKCDTPACVNPDHLFVGTQSENVIDCAKKRRTPRILSADQVREIRHMISQGVSYTKISDQTGVNITHITKIRHNKIYSYVSQTKEASK